MSSSTSDTPRSPAARVFGAARDVITDPRSFFRERAREDEVTIEPVRFVVGVLLIAGLFSGLYGLLGLIAGGLGFGLLVRPLLGFVGYGVGVGMTFLLCRVAGGSRATGNTAARVAAYATALAPVSAAVEPVPLLPLLVSAYAIYVWIVGAIELAGVPENRAWPIFGTLGALLLLFAFVASFGGIDGPPEPLVDPPTTN